MTTNHPIPGYRTEYPLGSGAMASVYMAVQESLDRHVALKIMSAPLAADSSFAERFLKEGRIVAQLNHPHIVTIYDIGVFQDRYFMAMEYLGGGTLKDKIREGLSAESSVHILSQLALALSYAHKRGFLHRDVKAENVLFRGNGEAVLTDFGIAKALSADATQMTAVGITMGTPRYMSPEQAMGRTLDLRSDLYSLGVLFFEMLTGRLPFLAEDSFALALKHVNDPAPRLPLHLACYQSIVDRLLAKEPNERFTNADAILAALDLAALDKDAPQSGRPVLFGHAEKTPPKPRTLWRLSSIADFIRAYLSPKASGIIESHSKTQARDYIAPPLPGSTPPPASAETPPATAFTGYFDFQTLFADRTPSPDRPDALGVGDQSNTFLMRSYAIQLLDPREKRIIREFLQEHEPDQLVQHIAHFPGAHFLISGYGSFGGTTLTMDICQAVIENLKKEHHEAPWIVRLEREDGLFTDTVKFRARLWPHQTKREIFVYPTSRGRDGEVALETFFGGLNAVLTGKNPIDHCVAEFFQPLEPWPPERTLLVVDKINESECLKTLIRSELLSHSHLTVILVVSREDYDRWPESLRQSIRQRGPFQFWPVPCLWECRYRIIERILHTLIDHQRADQDSAEALKTFQAYVAFHGRGCLGTILRELCRSHHWRYNHRGEPYLNLDRLDQDTLRHHAWLQNLLENHWQNLLAGNFVGVEDCDKARQAVYSLLDWMSARGGGFARSQVYEAADRTCALGIEESLVRQQLVDRLLTLLVEAGYLQPVDMGFTRYPVWREGRSAPTGERVWVEQAVPKEPAIIRPDRVQRSTVFISYARRDIEWLKRLQVHLRPLERRNTIQRWDDTMIQPGGLWKEEISRALESTKVAVLLVSPHFLASEFIAENELPPLLEAAESDGAIILPVIVAPCALDHCQELSRFQAVNSPSSPLLGQSEAEQEFLLVQLVNRIATSLA